MGLMNSKKAYQLLDKATVSIDRENVIYEAEDEIHADELRRAAMQLFEGNYEPYAKRIVVKNKP